MEPRKKNLQDLRDQNHCKHVGLVYHLAIYYDFHGLKLSYSLKFVRSYYFYTFSYTCLKEARFSPRLYK